jgi:hypothetical protein
MDVLFFLAFARGGVCLPSRYLAMGIHITECIIYHILAYVDQYEYILKYVG